VTEGTSNLLILGSGPAGLTAAIYGARAGLAPTLLHGIQPGGQLTITTDVENWPGETSILGPDLVGRMEEQARVLGVSFHADSAERVDLTQWPFVVEGEGGLTYRAKALIIATGAQARWLGLESEQRLRGFGVSACATCDGFFFRGKRVAVVGGGNTAVEEALYLTRFAEKVYLIHRRDSLRADRINQERLFAHPAIEVIWNSEVKEIHGTVGVGGVNAIDLQGNNGQPSQTLEIGGVFIAIGHDPATSIFRGKLDMDEDGYILTAPDSTATNIPGVFAAGDVRDRQYRQAVTAAGNGCMAALEVERWLGERTHGDMVREPEPA